MEKTMKIQFPIVLDSAGKLSRLQMMIAENWCVVAAVTHNGVAMFILETEVLEKDRKRAIEYINSLREADEELESVHSMMPGFQD